MKKVVSVSLGSSRRDKTAVARFLDVPIELARVGCDGDVEKARALIRRLDGTVDAIGLGGVDVYLQVAGERYVVEDGLRLVREAKATPVVDGSRVKETVERRAVEWLAEHGPVPLKGAKVLLVSSLDRFGMAEALAEVGADTVYGDMMFLAGVPYPIRSLAELAEIAGKMAREVSKLPIHMIYPVGQKQDAEPVERFPEFYREADVVAGDWHLMRRYMPRDMRGKMILTQTITPDDRAFLRERGVRWLVTTTPVVDGRSFATNVIEGAFTALLGRPPEAWSREDVDDLLRKMDYQPAVQDLERPG